jgi:DNA-directed RNA polymerase III subunit RPC2
MKECPMDPGGYFIVKGVEKVCLIQEQLSKNRIILELDGKGCVSASVTSSTHERKSRTVIVLRAGRIQLQHNTIGDDVPVVVVLKALGMTSDQEICACIGPEPELQDALQASLEEAAALGIFSQRAALEYIGGKVKAKRAVGRSHLSKLDEGRNIMAGVVLSHVPVERWNFRPKVNLQYTINKLNTASTTQQPQRLLHPFLFSSFFFAVPLCLPHGPPHPFSVLW